MNLKSWAIFKVIKNYVYVNKKNPIHVLLTNLFVEISPNLYKCFFLIQMIGKTMK